MTAKEYQNRSSAGPSVRRHRPSRSVASQGPQVADALTPEFLGLAATYENTLLFIGYEVKGNVEIVVYPAYRFPSDDRVQGYLGYLWVPLGTSWSDVLAEVDHIYLSAHRNYRLALSLRAQELRAHGAHYERAYDAIIDLFRESWHGFALRLKSTGEVTREGVLFEGKPPDPILVTLNGHRYTLMVFPTGSIALVTGDQRDRLKSLTNH